MKKNIVIILALLTAFTLTGCNDEQVAVSNLDTMQIAATDNQSLQQVLPVKGESFTLNCSYDTGNYNISEWRITDSKTLSMNVKLENSPADVEVMIEHVHCDINIKSTLAVVDGLQQDSMDDTYHGVSQDGFYVNNATEYNSVFAIEGYSETLISGWGFVCGSYGASTITEKRMTEGNLITYGKAYAQKVQIVYDLSIKNKDDQYYHTVSVISEFLIPLNTEKYATTKSNSVGLFK